MYHSIKRASLQINTAAKGDDRSFLQLSIALNLIPTTILSTGYLFFYTTLSALAICMINHLDAIFLYLQKTDELAISGDQIFNITVKEILKYAHSIHVRVIE